MKGFRKGGVIHDIDEHSVKEPKVTSDSAQWYKEVVGGATAPSVSGNRQDQGEEDSTQAPQRTFAHDSRRTQKSGPAAASAAGAYDELGRQEEEDRGQQRQAPEYAIPEGNIGFKLLCKAGWQQGQGLGVDNQGMQQPLRADANKGRRGLGASSKRAQDPGSAPAGASVGPGGGRAAAGAQPGGAPHSSGRHYQQQQQQQGWRDSSGGGGGGRGQPLIGTRYDRVASELSREQQAMDKGGLEARRKRHQQVWQAEVDDNAGKAIQRYMHLAFSDSTGEATTDTNPLLRARGRHRLSSSNPLL